jgi:hypothetical protein
MWLKKQQNSLMVNESKNCQEILSDLFMLKFPDLHNFNTCNSQTCVVLKKQSEYFFKCTPNFSLQEKGTTKQTWLKNTAGQ